MNKGVQKIEKLYVKFGRLYIPYILSYIFARFIANGTKLTEDIKGLQTVTF